MNNHPAGERRISRAEFLKLSGGALAGTALGAYTLASPLASPALAVPSLPVMGVVGSPAFPSHLDLAAEAGVESARYFGAQISWYKNPGSLPDVSAHRFARDWENLAEAGIEPLIQIYLDNAPSWASTGLSHNNSPKRKSVDPGAVADFAAHVVKELPFATHFKLGNEYDRDPRPQWLDKYAGMMRAGYRAIKEARPDAQVAIEGGYTLEIVQGLMERGLYEDADIIDHHCYGSAWTNESRKWSLKSKMGMMGEKGYDQPVIASEFGVQQGSGKGSYSPQKVAGLFKERADYFFEMGGSALFYFPWSSWKDSGGWIDSRFSNAYMVSEGGDRRPVFDAYKEVAKKHRGDEKGARPTNGRNKSSTRLGDPFSWMEGGS